ncbi:hypothetical protein [Mesorhizobium sp.]|uniref:hypothetical protein n=1 Tax=Mesorhizobium sp. TaxID=1871066 RepID=UPI00121A4265|nr:hypothetical protein [Mesorhizobium sp.]TIP09102.1 MAG: hypothetical protein E5X73_28815 [Mesorhizobium sp.]
MSSSTDITPLGSVVSDWEPINSALLGHVGPIAQGETVSAVPGRFDIVPSPHWAKIKIFPGHLGPTGHGEGASGVQGTTHWRGVPSSSLSLPDRPNSDRARRFVRLIEAIRKMAKLPDDDHFYLNPEIAKRTESLVALLHFNVEDTNPPKIFPHEGDAVLTWDSGSLKEYLTFELEEIDHTVIHKPTMIRCSETVHCTGAEDLQDWLIKFGGIVKSDSNVEKADAL